MSSNKTEKATPQHRKKAREQGDVARSRDLASLAGIVVAVFCVVAMASIMRDGWGTLYRGLLTEAAQEDLSVNGPVLYWTAVEVLKWIAIPLGAVLIVSVAALVAQGGIVVAPAALAPKMDRINPASRLSHLASLSSLSGLLKSIFPFVAIAFFGYSTLSDHWSELTRASGGEVQSTALLVLEMGRGFLWKAALVLLVWSGLDYLLIWRQQEGRLRMSREEIKREHKENDGDPHVKGQVRRRQRSMRNRKPLAGAATATMVITNPTHVAVALRYEPSMAAPEVVAKGLDLLAQKIKAIAAENDIPAVEDRTLARALYKSVEVGDTIPTEFYKAVAEILVTVFRAQAEVQQEEAKRRRLNASGGAVESR